MWLTIWPFGTLRGIHRPIPIVNWGTGQWALRNSGWTSLINVQVKHHRYKMWLRTTWQKCCNCHLGPGDSSGNKISISISSNRRSIQVIAVWHKSQFWKQYKLCPAILFWTLKIHEQDARVITWCTNLQIALPSMVQLKSIRSRRLTQARCTANGDEKGLFDTVSSDGAALTPSQLKDESGTGLLSSIQYLKTTSSDSRSNDITTWILLDYPCIISCYTYGGRLDKGNILLV